MIYLSNFTETQCDGDGGIINLLDEGDVTVPKITLNNSYFYNFAPNFQEEFTDEEDKEELEYRGMILFVN